MGCVLGKDVSPGIVSAAKSSSSLRVESRRKLDTVPVEGNEENASESKKKEEKGAIDKKPKEERKRAKPNPKLGLVPKQNLGEQVAAGWPSWLSEVCGEALNGWIPRRADSFEKIDKIGSGTYSNVYKARDTLTGKVVALKKVRFDKMEPESVKFMAREILILRRLDHQNVIKLEGLVTSRMSSSLYLVFEYMDHDLAGLAASPDIKFTESQVKCFVRQLLSGLQHCHEKGVLHRDIKGSNLLIDAGGILRIADFGLASFFDPINKHAMTSRVVTLWYRPPELLLGAVEYGAGIDLWSAGCILAELLAGKPIMPGRTEVEQLHKIYKLCGSPSEGYWRKYKLPNATVFKPREPYKRCIRETFSDFPQSSFPLIETLLAIDPIERLSATSALRSEFFKTEPFACEPSSLPKYPPTKEIDAKKRDDEARRMRAANKTQGESVKKQQRPRGRPTRPTGAPEANAETQFNIDNKRRLISQGNAKSRSEKFPPPHEDASVGFTLGASGRIDLGYVPHDIPFSSSLYSNHKDSMQMWSGPLIQKNPSEAGLQNGAVAYKGKNVVD